MSAPPSARAASDQLAFLKNGSSRLSVLPRFSETIERQGLPPIQSGRIETLQINVGKLCNQTCRHCHVDAGPTRREIMSRETFEECLSATRSAGISKVDLTGGAPEMNPNFRWFVAECRKLHVSVIVRCNLTILS